MYSSKAGSNRSTGQEYWRFKTNGNGTLIAKANAKSKNGTIDKGDVVVSAILNKGGEEQEWLFLRTPEDVEGALARREPGEVLWLEEADGSQHIVATALNPTSTRAASCTGASCSSKVCKYSQRSKRLRSKRWRRLSARNS